jgi:hypothetical protein
VTAAPLIRRALAVTCAVMVGALGVGTAQAAAPPATPLAQPQALPTIAVTAATTSPARTFQGCGAPGSGSIPTTGCVIVLNRTRGWTKPGEPTYVGGFEIQAARNSATTTGGSHGWIPTNTQSAQNRNAAAPLITQGAWAGAFCRTAYSRCQINTWWRIAGGSPLADAVRTRGGETELSAWEWTRASGTANQGRSEGNAFVLLQRQELITRTQNGRYDAVARNRTVRLKVINRVENQRLALERAHNTASAVEDLRARLPQSVNAFGQDNGSRVLAPQLEDQPRSAGRGEYGYVTRTEGDVYIDVPYVWEGSTIGGRVIRPNGCTAVVHIHLRSGATNHDNRLNSVEVTCRNAPRHTISVSATDPFSALVTVTFFD